MARSHARVQFGMYRKGLDGATSWAKLVYGVVLVEQTINHCGVGVIRVTRWAKDASLTVEETEKALRELEEGGWLILDEDTEEVFVRTLIRNDGVAEQPYVLKGALREALLVSSERIKRALAAELRKLPPRKPDGEGKNGRKVTYPDPHATADVLDPPPEKPSPKGSETLLQSAGDPSESPLGGGGGGGGGGGSSSSTSSSTSVGKPAPKRGTRIPEDFKVTPDMVAWARTHAPDVDGRSQTARFVDHFTAAPGSKGVKLDWVATWRNWMREAQDRLPRTGSHLRSVPVQAALPIEDDDAFATLRADADAVRASRLIRATYIEPSRPPGCPESQRAWARRHATEFIDSHEDEIRQALTERRAG